MRGLAPVSLLLLLAAAGPSPKERAQQALQNAEQSRRAALAAEQAAKQEAAAAAAERERLAAERVAASERLQLAETAIGQMALRLDELGRDEAAAKAMLAERARAFAPVLPLIERLSLYPAETLLAVPAPPEDAVRGVFVLQGVANEIERQAAALRREEARVAEITAEITDGRAKLKAAEDGQRAAAAQLDQQIQAASQNEATAEAAAAAAAAKAADEAARAKTLQGVVARIAEAERQAARAAAARAAEAAKREQVALARPPVPPALARRSPGAPVAGVMVSGFGAPTPAGPATGVRYQTAPGAHVLSPCGGSVEFAAPFRSYGELVIVDCGRDYRFVLAGMAELLVRPGTSVAAGEAVGVMAGWNPDSKDARPTLYLELHHGGRAVDPMTWLHARG